MRNCLKKWYEEPHASKIMNAEGFQVSKFGSQPSHEELLKLFPMVEK
jgi:hypothetical protein